MDALDRFLFMSLSALFLVNSWWCIFISQDPILARVFWWVISLFIFSWIVGFFKMFSTKPEIDKKAKDENK